MEKKRKLARQSGEKGACRGSAGEQRAAVWQKMFAQSGVHLSLMATFLLLLLLLQ